MEILRKKRMLLCAAAVCTVLCGCGANGEYTEKSANAAIDSKAVQSSNLNKSASGKVSLVVWGAEEDKELYAQMLERFQENYKGQAEFDITYAVQGETNCKDALIGDLEGGEDVFTFADDQLNTLVAAGALEPVQNADAIRAENLEGAVEAATVNNTLYAYPLTADNGYFLYYNKQYFSDEDVQTMDGLLKVAAEHGKKVTMDWSSGWYVYALFGNTGLTVGLEDNGITNFCTWNAVDGAVKGIDVAEAMLAIAQQPSFLSTDDSGFMAGVQDGSVIAGVSGVWNAIAVEQAWGENYAAAKLPTYTCAGRQIQMASFSGYKLVGVNAYSQEYLWASRLAEWITSEENQSLRFAMRGQGPSNTRAAASASVQHSPAIAALLEQSEYASLQRIGGKFWEPVQRFSENMAAGNRTGQALQEQLDNMVEGITAQ